MKSSQQGKPGHEMLEVGKTLEHVVGDVYSGHGTTHRQGRGKFARTRGTMYKLCKKIALEANGTEFRQGVRKLKSSNSRHLPLCLHDDHLVGGIKTFLHVLDASSQERERMDLLLRLETESVKECTATKTVESMASLDTRK